MTDEERIAGARRVGSMLGDYLRARRAVLQPENVGLFRDEHRRVGGLRRQEIADLAGISTDYYLRLEQGRDQQPSDQVVFALARALQVGDFGLRHMRRLVQLQTQRRVPPEVEVVDAVQSVLDFWPGTPVAVMDSNFDLVAANDLALALDDGALTPGANLVVAMFEHSDQSADGWLEMVEDCVADLRFRCDPDDVRLQAIVGRLSIRDATFRRLWARHDSRPWTSGTVHCTVSGIERLPFRFQSLEHQAIEGCSVVAFHPGDDRARAALEALTPPDRYRVLHLASMTA